MRFTIEGEQESWSRDINVRVKLFKECSSHPKTHNWQFCKSKLKQVQYHKRSYTEFMIILLTNWNWDHSTQALSFKLSVIFPQWNLSKGSAKSFPKIPLSQIYPKPNALRTPYSKRLGKLLKSPRTTSLKRTVKTMLNALGKNTCSS